MNTRGMLQRSVAICAGGLLQECALSSTNSRLYVPPEDSPHSRTIMQWPVSREVHSDRYFLEILQKTIADIANTIVAFEPVVIEEYMVPLLKENKK